MGIHVGKLHLTLGVEAIVAHGDGGSVGEGHSLHEGIVQVQAGIHGHLVAVVDEVEITVVSHQLVAGLSDVVDIQVTVDHAVLLGRLVGERGKDLGREHLAAGLTGLPHHTFHTNGRLGHGDPITGGMTLGGGHGLCHKDLTASGAVLALGQARFGTGGSHGGVGDLGVSRSGNGGLSNQDLTASGTVLALGEARFGTGGSHGGVNDLGVSRSGNGGLGNQDLTASGAMLALGQARFGTGGGHGGVNDLGVRMLGGGAYSFGKNHLAVRAKGVAANGNGRAIGEGHAAYVGRAQVQGRASGDLITVVDEVVIPLKLNQLVAGLLHVLDV